MFRNKFVDDGEYAKEDHAYLEPVKKLRPHRGQIAYRGVTAGKCTHLKDTSLLIQEIWENLNKIDHDGKQNKVAQPKVRFPRLRNFINRIKLRVTEVYNNVRNRLAQIRKSHKSNTTKPLGTGVAQPPMGGDKLSVHDVDRISDNTCCW